MHCCCVIESGSWRCLPIKTQESDKESSESTQVAIHKCGVDTYVPSTMSQVIVSRSRTKTSFNNLLLLSSPPKTITLEPTSVVECPPRATWNILHQHANQIHRTSNQLQQKQKTQLFSLLNK